MSQPESKRYLVFSLNGEFFGVPLMQVKQVVKNPRVCPVPHTLGSFKGVIQCRDREGTRMVSVVNLSSLLGIPVASAGGPEENGIALILEYGDRLIGAMVDDLQKVEQYDDSLIQRDVQIETLIPPGKLLGIASDGDHLVQIIDLAAILSDRNFAVQKPSREAA